MNNRVLLAIAAALLLPPAALAQKDRIVLVDGTVIDGVTVTSFTIGKVEFRQGGSQDSRSTDMVAELNVQRVKDVYKRSYAAKGSGQGPGMFLSEAEEQKDPFLKQFGYVEAARMFLNNAQYADAFAVLDELAAQVPNSGYLPLTFTAKIEAYLSMGRGKAADALSVARDYERTAQVQGFPPGFALEARYYKLLGESLAGEVPPERLREQLQALVREASGHPDVVNRAQLQIANSLRAENKLAEASAIYEDLLEKGYTTESVRAGAYLGLGHAKFAQGSASEPQPFREALLYFLRVYIETPDANAETIAEALFMASQSAERWGGDDSGRMARRLRWILRRDYPDSAWNER